MPRNFTSKVAYFEEYYGIEPVFPKTFIKQAENENLCTIVFNIVTQACQKRLDNLLPDNSSVISISDLPEYKYNKIDKDYQIKYSISSRTITFQSINFVA